MDIEIVVSFLLVIVAVLPIVVSAAVARIRRESLERPAAFVALSSSCVYGIALVVRVLFMPLELFLLYVVPQRILDGQTVPMLSVLELVARNADTATVVAASIALFCAPLVLASYWPKAIRPSA